MQQATVDAQGAPTTEDLVSAITIAAQRLQWSADELNAHRVDALRKTLTMAKEQSPFYADRLAGIDVRRATPDDLVQIEPTTKDDLIAGMERISTRRDLSRAALEKHVSEMTKPTPIDDYFVFASSGSSGRRALSPMLQSDAVQNVATLIACQAMQERRATETRPSCALVVAGSQPSHLGTATAVLYGLLGPIGRTESLPASTPIEKVAELARSVDPTSIMGFASVVARLARLQLAGQLNLRPEQVVSIGEPLLAEDAAVMTEAWGCPIHSAYGCSELGWMAASVGPGGPMLAFDDQFVIEPLDAEREPLSFGEESTSVCLTTLERREFPLIRYELADRVCMLPASEESPLEFTRIESVLGRDDEWFRYGEIEVHPATFRAALLKFKMIDEYQVIQTARGARVLAVAFEPAPAAQDIVDSLRSALGEAGLPEAEVEVEYVDSLDRQAAQKLRRFVPIT